MKKYSKNLNKGFTLAEVLIVLGVIGVVAALTLPTLISNINDKVVARQIQVINRKINQGTESMQVRGALLENYGSTSAFIDELSKDMKIISKCDSEHLTDCWPYEKITVKQPVGEEKDIPILSHVNGTEAFQMTGNWGEVMGIIFGNGTPMLLSYNKNCPAIDPDSTYEVDKSTGMSETSQCIAGVYDINGKRGPNKLYQDVIPFRANGYTPSYWLKINDIYFRGMPFVVTPQQANTAGKNGDCPNIVSTGIFKDETGLFGAAGKDINVKKDLAHLTGCYYNADYWLASAIQCSANGMRLPNKYELEQLAIKLYPDPLIGTWDEAPRYTGTRTIPKDFPLSIFGSSGFSLWENSQYVKSSAYNRSYGTNSSIRQGALGYMTGERNNNKIHSVCVSD